MLKGMLLPGLSRFEIIQRRFNTAFNFIVVIAGRRDVRARDPGPQRP